MSKTKKTSNISQIVAASRAAERAARVEHMANSGGRSAFRSVTFPDRRKEANRKACRGNNW